MSFNCWGCKAEKEERIEWLLVDWGIEVGKRLGRTKKNPGAIPGIEMIYE